eukprot:323134_1
MANNYNRTITLKGGGGQKPRCFEIDVQSAKLSKWVSTIMECCSEEITSLEVRGINANSSLETVVKYLKYCKGVEQTINFEYAKELITNISFNDNGERTNKQQLIEELKMFIPDADFINHLIYLTYKQIKSVLICANYMDIKSLLHLMVIVSVLTTSLTDIVTDTDMVFLSSSIFDLQISLYDKGKLEQFLGELLLGYNKVIQLQMHDISRHVFRLLHRNNIYSYFIHKQLNMIVWKLDSVNAEEFTSIGVINTNMNNEYNEMDKSIVCGFVREIEEMYFEKDYVVHQVLLKLLQSYIA